jgi:hypothetical protein
LRVDPGRVARQPALRRIAAAISTMTAPLAIRRYDVPSRDDFTLYRAQQVRECASNIPARIAQV